jgi:hypothetical protein
MAAAQSVEAAEREGDLIVTRSSPQVIARTSGEASAAVNPDKGTLNDPAALWTVMSDWS